MNKIIKKIEENIKNIGGENFLIFFLEGAPYNLKFDRYEQVQAIPIIDVMRDGKGQKWILYGYLLNLGLKHLDIIEEKNCSKIKIQSTIEIIVKLSLKLSEKIFNNDIINFNPYLMKGKFKESVFTRLYFDRIVPFNQYDYKFFRKFIKLLIYDIDKITPYRTKGINNINKVIEFILDKARNKKGVIKFTNEMLFSNLSEEEHKLFKKIFVKNHLEINKEYNHPFLIQYINSFEKPLIEINNKYIFISKNLSIYSFYISVLEYLNHLEIDRIDGKQVKQKPNVNTLVGRCLEVFIYKELSKLSDDFTYGYDEEGNEYDLIYIKDKKSIIFEIKKKGFINKSLGGAVDSIFDDYSNSYMKGQEQLLKRKNYLKNKKIINIYEEKNKKGLKFEREINYQNIQFISITLDNFNSLGEKHFFNLLLDYLIINKENITIGVNDIEENIRLKEYNIKLKKSLKQLLLIVEKINAQYKKYMKNEECKKRDDPDFTWDFSFKKNLLDTWTLDISTLFSLINYYRIEEKTCDIIETMFDLILSMRNCNYNALSNFSNFYYKIVELNERKLTKQ